MKKVFLLTLSTLFLLTACAGPQTNTGKGALYGAGGGAAAGALAQSTLIGAAIGAAVGGAAGAGVGHMMDKQEAEYRNALAASDAAAVRREGDLLAITLKGDVTFDTDSTTVRPGLYSEIDRIANVMVRYPQTLIQVEGYTDSTGSEAYNQRLSERRAEAVKNLLVQRGVDPSRIYAIGFGENMPIATNDTPEGRQLNRRVEIKVAPTNSGSMG